MRSKCGRCAGFVWLTVGLLAFQNETVHAQAKDQVKKLGQWSRDFAQSMPAVPFVVDLNLARRLEAAHDAIEEESWGDATRLLQSLIDNKEDSLVCLRRMGADGKAVVCWTGVRAEADKMLAKLPTHGREFYESTNGPRARAMLTEARQQGDLNLLEEIARRYFHTAAGVEATRLLGLHHLDRGRSNLAAQCFRRVLDRGNLSPLAPATLAVSVLAFRQSHDSRATKTWSELVTKSPAGVRIGQRQVTLPELEKELFRLDPVLFETNNRFTQDLVTTPRLEAKITRPTYHESATHAWLQVAVHQHESKSEVVIPAAIPLMLKDRFIYRSSGGLHAIDRETGKPIWQLVSAWGLDSMALDTRYQQFLQSWVGGYLIKNPHLLFENSTVGTLSTDGQRVYAVEDFVLPPYPPLYFYGSRRRWEMDPESTLHPDLASAAFHSRLMALDVESGKPMWEIGGRGETDGSELRDSYFMGPPVPLDGRLYTVVEKQHQLSLVCLDAAQGNVLWTQPLAVSLTGLLIDVARRSHAVQPAHSEGILVCPTNLGVVVGVDLFHRSLAWAHIYRDEAPVLDWEQPDLGRRGRGAPRDLPRLRDEWKAAPPAIAAGKVVVTTPDAPALLCLDLHNGAQIWKSDRMEDDLFLAGIFNNAALVVGRKGCRALRLDDGKPLWSADTGLVSGRGVAAGNIYYLPCRATVKEKRPAIYAIDLKRGTVLAHSAMPQGEVLGNLVKGDDAIYSQSVLAVTAYVPEKKEKKESDD